MTASAALARRCAAYHDGGDRQSASWPPSSPTKPGTRRRRARSGGRATWPGTCAAWPTTYNEYLDDAPRQPARPADGHRRAPGHPGPQARPAERRRAGGPGRDGTRARAHRGVRRLRPRLRPPDPARSGTCRTTATADTVVTVGGMAGRGLRGVAPARLGPGPGAGQGLPARRPRTSCWPAGGRGCPTSHSASR